MDWASLSNQQEGVEFGGAAKQSSSDFDFLKVLREMVLQRDGSKIPGRRER